ncbi:hypothetical protein KAR48_17800 [bacterium]|nr:hypothetical protein [bacterium]
MLLFLLSLINVPAFSQNRWKEFSGGMFGSALILLPFRIDNPANISAAHFLVSVAGGIGGVYIVGKYFCDEDGSLPHCILGGCLGGAMGGLFLHYLKKTREPEPEGESMMGDFFDITPIVYLCEYLVLLAPSAFGATVGFNRNTNQANALINLKKEKVSVGALVFSQQFTYDYFKRAYPTTQVKVMEIAF